MTYGQTAQRPAAHSRPAPMLRQQIGYQGPFGSLQAYSPMRDGRTDEPGTGITDQRVRRDQRLRRWGCRRRRSATTTATPPPTVSSSLPGDYYLVFAADADYRDPSYEMPFRLDLQVRGEEAGSAGVRRRAGASVTRHRGPAGAPVTARGRADRGAHRRPRTTPTTDEADRRDYARRRRRRRSRCRGVREPDRAPAPSSLLVGVRGGAGVRGHRRQPPPGRCP